MLISFSLCLLVFVAIGILSVRKSRTSRSDYLLASRSIAPWLVALSAVATMNSGYMFIGMIGYTYVYGLSSIWLMIGWLVGDYAASFLVHSRLSRATARTESLTFSGLLSQWQGTAYHRLRLIAGVITVIFLGTYAAAQLQAGSKALYVLLGWPHAIGASVGAVIVLVYCFSGGIRASIWTDAAQSMVMLVAMGMMSVVGLVTVGGGAAFLRACAAVSPDYMAWFTADLSGIGSLLFIIGWLVAGFGVIGQPHIMVRFMALDSPDSMPTVRYYYYTWYLVFYALTIFVGLLARLQLPIDAGFDPELALPMVAQHLLSEAWVGVVLAGLFAATLSTADSQILSCTAAITTDFSVTLSYRQTKLVTVLITLFILCIALVDNSGVFQLVIIAWGALAAAFAPLLTVYACGGKPSESRAIAMITVGLGTILLWRFLGLSPVVYEVVPGITAGFLVYAAGLIDRR